MESVAIEYDAAQARGEVARPSLIFMIERDPDYILRPSSSGTAS